MPSEIRIWDEAGTYRVIYTARLNNAIDVLHTFQKKTQATLKHDIELAKVRLTELIMSHLQSPKRLKSLVMLEIVPLIGNLSLCSG